MAEPIKVAVRVRPFNQRELAQAGNGLLPSSVVAMEGSKTTIYGDTPKTFQFDFAFWSVDATSGDFASQEEVFEKLGAPLVKNGLDGYNGTLFCYGQTGSGKSYTAMGFPDQPGCIPRFTEEIYNSKTKLESEPDRELRIWISFLEIYNEHLRDLLVTKDEDQGELKIIDHPKVGICIPSLTEAVCQTRNDVDKLIQFGLKRRVTAATAMNAQSSRSHAVFIVKVQHLDGERPAPGAEDMRKALNSKVNIVDLAGSERQAKTGAEGLRLKEGGSINQSLSTLALVIKDLSEKAAKKTSTKIKAAFRASKLTFLLKDSLIGNSKTAMIACVSPAADNTLESMSTLRFASSVKKIQTFVVQNKDEKDKLIDQLRAEIKMLKCRRGSSTDSLGGDSTADTVADAEERKQQMQELEHMLQYHQKSYDEMAKESQDAHEERKQTLERGLSTDAIREAFHVEQNTPYLLNMSDDPFVAGMLIYYIAASKPTTVGKLQDNKICLKGIGIADNLCTITNTGNVDIVINKTSADGRVCVNGRLLQEGESRKLRHGDKVYIGRAYAFKLTVPLDDHARGHDGGLSLEGLEDEMSAIEDSPSWCSFRDFHDEVMNQLPEHLARAFFEELKQGCKLCDEANDITAECRADENLDFQVDCTSAVPSTVVIKVMHTVPNENNGEPLALYLWSVHQMSEHLERMRDYHTAWLSRQAVGEDQKDWAVDHLLDPWHEAHPGAIASRISELETLLDVEKQTNSDLRKAKQRAKSKSLFVWMGAEETSVVRLSFQGWKDLTKALVEQRKAKEAAKVVPVAAPPRKGKNETAISPRGKVAGTFGKPKAAAKSRTQSASRDLAPNRPPSRGAERPGTALGASSKPSATEARSNRKVRSSSGQVSIADKPRTPPAVIAEGAEDTEFTLLDALDPSTPNSTTEEAPSAQAATVEQAPSISVATEGSKRSKSSGVLADGPAAEASTQGRWPANEETNSNAVSAATPLAGSAVAQTEAENESLRRQLEAAWQLVAALNNQMQQQEKLLQGATEEQAPPLTGSMNGIGKNLSSRVHRISASTPRSVSKSADGGGVLAGSLYTVSTPASVIRTATPGGVAPSMVQRRDSNAGVSTRPLSPPPDARARSHSPILGRRAYYAAGPVAVGYPAGALPSAMSMPVVAGQPRLSSVGLQTTGGSMPSQAGQPLVRVPVAPYRVAQPLPAQQKMGSFPGGGEDLFNMLDRDGDGVITRSEFAALGALATPRVATRTVPTPVPVATERYRSVPSPIPARREARTSFGGPPVTVGSFAVGGSSTIVASPSVAPTVPALNLSTMGGDRTASGTACMHPPVVATAGADTMSASAVGPAFHVLPPAQERAPSASASRRISAMEDFVSGQRQSAQQVLQEQSPATPMEPVAVIAG